MAGVHKHLIEVPAILQIANRYPSAIRIFAGLIIEVQGDECIE